MIRIKGLNKYFNKGRQNEIHVINDITLELPERGMVAIFGKSGCGKTTLLNVIGGLDSFRSGELEIEGKSIKKKTDRLRNEYIGYIFQNYNLNPERSCFDNVADALRLCGVKSKSVISERVMAALKNVGMEKYVSRTPDTLSGGQQQRIAIARAIVKNPRIILADEPTGNLDEANTVMIMDLLRRIANDHLVLLVTHEANLVDYYCDKVIELSDGKVVNVKNNSSVGGFAARDKNTVYLGELEKSEADTKGAHIEYYGDAPSEPLKLRIVNSGGKLYVRIDTPRVQIIDEFSEVKLREGVFEENPSRNEISESVDMSKLPPIKGKHFGRLFTLGSSIKSGYISNFRNFKKGKKLLRGCMCMFAAVIVFMSALFGTAFKDLISASDSYNHNVFYVYTPDGETSEALTNALKNKDGAIDSLRLMYSGIPYGDEEISFRLGAFETFGTDMFSEAFSTNAVYLNDSLAKDLELVEGKKEPLSDEEIVISTAVADALLEKSSLGYVREYRDLLGLITNSVSVGEKTLRIAGIVRSDETAVYLTERTMAKYALSYSGLHVCTAEDVKGEVGKGEAVLFISYKEDGVDYPSVGESVNINGKSFKVSRIERYFTEYAEWLKGNSVVKKEMGEYFEDILLAEMPDIDKSSEEFGKRYSEIENEKYFEYMEYYYAELDSFLEALLFFEPYNFEAWLAYEKNVLEARCVFGGEKAYYAALKYKEVNGSYPTLEQFNDNIKTEDIYEKLGKYYSLYETVFYSENRETVISYYSSIYALNESDYISLSRHTGKTDKSARDYYFDDSITGGYDFFTDTYYVNPGSVVYTVIHSSDPAKTEKYLKENFSYLSSGNEYIPEIVSPRGIFGEIIKDTGGEIVRKLITMSVVLAVMCLCMYFIMRSSLISRIKEVGIYRAIGVSRRNLVFKFFIEALVLTTLTVFVGFIVTSVAMSVLLGMSSLTTSIFYYPFWLAVIVAVILYVVCTLCGILPILSLLGKTPSKILAKYDI